MDTICESLKGRKPLFNLKNIRYTYLNTNSDHVLDNVDYTNVQVAFLRFKNLNCKVIAAELIKKKACHAFVRPDRVFMSCKYCLFETSDFCKTSLKN